MLADPIRRMRSDGGWQNEANRSARGGREADYAQTLTEDVVAAVRKKYFALTEFCDYSLGRVLDLMDEYHLWQDTMLIVNTDHGFFLSEHNWWGKGPMPEYQELVHIPLFIWDPRSGVCGESREALVQTIDIAPTLLDFFGLAIPADMTGKSLYQTIISDEPVRRYAMMGYFGGVVNVTDGHYMLMKAMTHPEIPVYEYTHMPTHMNKLFSVAEMQKIELTKPRSFSKGCPLMRIPPEWILYETKLSTDLLFDLNLDPKQQHPLEKPEIKAQMEAGLLTLFQDNDAPDELYRRYDWCLSLDAAVPHGNIKG